MNNPIQIQGCCVEPPPVLVPETIDRPNCDGTTTPATFPNALERVVMIQDKPLVVCLQGAVVDFETGCSSIDGRTIVLVSKAENGVYTQELVEADGLATPVTDGSVLVKCGKDLETSESCYQLIADPTVKYTRISIINTETLSVNGVVWLNSSGLSVAEPSGIEPCKEERTVLVSIECDTIAEKKVSSTVEAVIDHIVMVKNVCEKDEVDLLKDEWMPICVNGVQWYSREESKFNNNTESQTTPIRYYKEGVLGVSTTVAPIGTIVDGACSIPPIVIRNSGVEYWVRLDSSTPTQEITQGDINDVLYDSVSISNMMSYSDGGDFRPFRGQDVQNQTVLWVEVLFTDATNGDYNVWYAIPSGTKVIEMENASIKAINRIAIADNIDGDLSGNNNKVMVKGFSNGSAPSTPINVLITFNLSA